MKTNIEVDNIDLIRNFFGCMDANASEFEKLLGVTIARDEQGISVSGAEADVARAQSTIKTLLKLAKTETLNSQHIRLVADLMKDNFDVELSDVLGVVAVTARGKQIRVKSLGQRLYVDAILKNELTIAVGPAGTGKTYLAVALAAAAYKNKQVDKIILTRPAVEAGEKLGFLPGDLQNKVDPYLRPLYDALTEMFGSEVYLKLMERGIIEVAPLAYMRGRTLSNSFIILDEAQNTTKEQMKMFLTRMGENSKVVVNGDVTQIDLPASTQSGLIHALQILKGVAGVEIVELTFKDVARHHLVQNIIQAYEKDKFNPGSDLRE
ncbi:MAG TPA: PhoH family protein [Eubacteriales bacterium]|nr:PhoH family protein [Eubacteriales bacterium]HRU84883.1 PhoH family protein [Eubacteriales bacterium]